MLLIAYFITQVFLASSYKILVIAPGYSNSHVMFYARAASLLAADATHQVTFLVEEYHTDSQRAALPTNVEQIRFPMDEDITEFLTKFNQKAFQPSTNFWGKWRAALFLSDIGCRGCKKMVQNESLMQNLKKRKFDALILPMITLCEFGMAEVLEINTTIWLSSGLMNDIQGWASGAPSPPSFVPNLLSPYTDRMIFYERLSNFWKFTFSYFIYHFRHNRPQNEIFRLVSKNPNFPDLWTKLAPKASILLNNDLFLDNARPWSHNVKYIGGDGLEKFSKLDDYWSKIIADDHRDLVIISFGSIANTSGLACNWTESFLAAFDEFPNVQFLWRFTGSLCTMHEPPKNVLLMDWLPQKELLASGKVRAFITHSGFNSILEAVRNGVPLITIPLFWDQFRNAAFCDKAGISVTINKESVSFPTIVDALTKILRNDRYKSQAEQISQLMKSAQAEERKETIEFWVRHAIRHSHFLHKNYIKMANQLNIFQYFLFDVYLAMLIFCSLITLCVHRIVVHITILRFLP